MPKLTIKDKTKYLRIALALQNIGVTEEIAEQIILTYEQVLIKGGKFSVNDAVDIESIIDKKRK